MQEYIELISSTGFPIVVALYFMVIHTKAVKENTRVLRDLETLIKHKRGC